MYQIQPPPLLNLSRRLRPLRHRNITILPLRLHIPTRSAPHSQKDNTQQNGAHPNNLDETERIVEQTETDVDHEGTATVVGFDEGEPLHEVGDGADGLGYEETEENLGDG